MNGKIILKPLTLIVALLFIISIGGAYATWYYSRGVCDDVYEVLPLDVFPWSGAEILPEEDQVGKNHRSLIEIILNGTIKENNGKTTYLGLNYQQSYLNSEIESRSEGSWWATSDTLGSMDFWEKSDIDKYFNTSNENISFVIYFPDGVSDTYYLYTTDVKLNNGDSANIAIGENIYPIYQTVLKKNSQGVWEATETKMGYAKSAWYDNRITGSLLKYPSFDPSTWKEETLGTTANNAIWSYMGQNTTAYVDSADTDVYYKLKPSQSTTYTVYSSNENAKIYILDKNQKQISVSSGAQGTNKVTFQASANTVYYIKMSGSTSIPFSIS
ncbi:MAG: hypothetical protein E7593_03600 [Ruminococcaceae bacterium]|nr:hypothetical protein [Oscillospiraceae bacterium]